MAKYRVHSVNNTVVDVPAKFADGREGVERRPMAVVELVPLDAWRQSRTVSEAIDTPERAAYVAKTFVVDAVVESGDYKLVEAPKPA